LSHFDSPERRHITRKRERRTLALDRSRQARRITYWFGDNTPKFGQFDNNSPRRFNNQAVSVVRDLVRQVTNVHVEQVPSGCQAPEDSPAALIRCPDRSSCRLASHKEDMSRVMPWEGRGNNISHRLPRRGYHKSLDGLPSEANQYFHRGVASQNHLMHAIGLDLSDKRRTIVTMPDSNALCRAGHKGLHHRFSTVVC
jgi:hypothetical protein